MLPDDHASKVAAAMGKAIVETVFHSSPMQDEKTASGSSMAVNNLYATKKYAKILKKSMEAIDARSDEVLQRDLSEEALDQLCKLQQDELFFLRAVVKHLVLGVENKESTERKESIETQETNQSAAVPDSKSHNPIGTETKNPERPKNLSSEIPEFIELCSDRNEDNVLLEDDVSQLTPSEGDFLVDGCLPTYQCNNILFPFPQQDGTLVCSLSSRRPNYYTDLKPGEIRDSFARSLEFSVYMNDVQALLSGKYTGKLSVETGLPHGKGVFRFANRDIYIGDFWNGFLHGTGVLFTRRKRSNRKVLLKLSGHFHHNDFMGV